MDIHVKSLTTCDVASDGGNVSLGFEDASGAFVAVHVSISQIGAMILTLPGLLEAALKVRYGDQSLRYTYPLASWRLEQASDASQRIITLETEDGFRVRFSIAKAEQNLLGEALISEVTTPTMLPH